MKLGLITNRQSQRNKDNAAEIEQAIRDFPDLLVARLETIADLSPALCEFAVQKVELIIVDGGDGTMAATVTLLLETQLFDRLPKLALLAGGMTNLIAHDVGLRGNRADALRRIVRASAGKAPLHIHPRPVLRVAFGRHAPQYGFFFGAAAAYGGSMLAREKIHALGIKHGPGAALGVFGALLGSAFGSKPGSLAAGVPIAVTADGRALPDGARFVLLVTSLNRLLLGLWPFWDRGEGPLRFIDVIAPPRRLLAALPSFLLGRPFRWMDRCGYSSAKARELVLRLDTPMMLDGEFLYPQGTETVTISAEHLVEFVRP